MRTSTAREAKCLRHSGFIILSSLVPAYDAGALTNIEEIFYSALDREPDQIGVFLDTACQGDELLRAEVEALLAAYQPARGFIETSAVGLAAKILEKQADLRVGQTMGHYQICERIGTGGMGEVYLATDIIAGRKAALKLLPLRFTGDAERLQRFEQEARAVVALNHPNILTVYEIGEDHSSHYIASELIEGETLRQRLRAGGWDWTKRSMSRSRWRVRSPLPTKPALSIATSSRRTSCCGLMVT